MRSRGLSSWLETPRIYLQEEFSSLFHPVANKSDKLDITSNCTERLILFKRQYYSDTWSVIAIARLLKLVSDFIALTLECPFEHEAI